MGRFPGILARSLLMRRMSDGLDLAYSMGKAAREEAVFCMTCKTDRSSLR